jgi:hypothetical protein
VWRATAPGALSGGNVCERGADKLNNAPVGAPPPFYLEANLSFRAQGLGCNRIARTKSLASARSRRLSEEDA